MLPENQYLTETLTHGIMDEEAVTASCFLWFPPRPLSPRPALTCYRFSTDTFMKLWAVIVSSKSPVIFKAWRAAVD